MNLKIFTLCACVLQLLVIPSCSIADNADTTGTTCQASDKSDGSSSKKLPLEKDTADQIELVSRLVEFIPQAAFDHFANGSSGTYDVSVFVVLEPEEYRGKKFNIRHSETPMPGTMWREVGSEYRVTLRSELISSFDFYTGTDPIDSNSKRE